MSLKKKKDFIIFLEKGEGRKTEGNINVRENIDQLPLARPK